MLLLNENKTKIIHMYESGIPTNKIAKEFSCNPGSIYFKLKEWNIDVKKRQKFSGDLRDYVDKIIELYDSGIGSYKISKMLNISKPTILRILKEKTVVRDSKRDNNNLLKDKKDLIEELFKTKNMTQIAKVVGYGEPSVYRLLKKYGHDTYKYKCKYSIDENFFKVIDTPDKAYVLGWIYSDGNVMKKGKIRISIQEGDKHILEEIKDRMKYTGELIYKKPKNARCKPQSLLNIDRVEMADDLIKLGAVPNKSLILTFPTSEQVPEHLLSHFIRGVFDGDGSISIKKNKYLSCAITSTFSFCDSLSNYLSTIGINATNFYYRKPTKPTGSLFFGRKEDVIKFLNWMYKDADIKLNRKFAKAKDFVSI